MIVSWAKADSVEMEIVVGRKTSTITAITASALTTVQVNTTSIWQTRVSVRGRDGLGSTVLGTMSADAAVSVEMGGLGASRAGSSCKSRERDDSDMFD